jgi:hypothetical protein
MESIYRSRELMKKYLPPDQRDYLDRPKGIHLHADTIALILGMFLLIGIIYLALITPSIIGAIQDRLFGMLPNQVTQFEIAGKTYDTKEIMMDLFENNLSKYQFP